MGTHGFLESIKIYSTVGENGGRGRGTIWECFSPKSFSWERFQNQKINTVLKKAGITHLKSSSKYSHHLKPGPLTGYHQRPWLPAESLEGTGFCFIYKICNVPELLFVFMVKLVIKEERSREKENGINRQYTGNIKCIQSKWFIALPVEPGNNEYNKCVSAELLFYFKPFLRLFSPFNLRFFFGH